MALLSAGSAVAILAASMSSTPAFTSDRELVTEALSNLVDARRCLPATHPGGGPTAACFKRRLLKARLKAAVDLLHESGEEIDLGKIENVLSEDRRGIGDSLETISLLSINALSINEPPTEFVTLFTFLDGVQHV